MSVLSISTMIGVVVLLIVIVSFLYFKDSCLFLQDLFYETLEMLRKERFSIQDITEDLFGSNVSLRSKAYRLSTEDLTVIYTVDLSRQSYKKAESLRVFFQNQKNRRSYFLNVDYQDYSGEEIFTFMEFFRDGMEIPLCKKRISEKHKCFFLIKSVIGEIRKEIARDNFISNELQLQDT
jgi:hypothetical protein